MLNFFCARSPRFPLDRCKVHASLARPRPQALGPSLSQREGPGDEAKFVHARAGRCPRWPTIHRWYTCPLRLSSSERQTMASSPTDEYLSPYKTIGGKGSKIVRHPSELHLIPERSGSGCSNKRPQRSSNGSSPTSSDTNALSSCNEAILKWDESEVVSWLHEIGFAEYEV